MKQDLLIITSRLLNCFIQCMFLNNIYAITWVLNNNTYLYIYLLFTIHIYTYIYIYYLQTSSIEEFA